MNIQYFLLFGFAFAELGIIFCRGEVECPNAPVIPYQMPTPVTPYPPAVPIQTTCCSNQPIPAGCCSNQQINPCHAPNPGCCYQSHTSTTSNCVCPTNQITQCSSQSCCQSCGSTLSCTGSTTCCSNQPIPATPVIPYPIPTPVTPYPLAVPTQTTCCSNQPIPAGCCSNQQINPCHAPNPGCCYQCQTSTTSNCVCPTNQITQCSSQSCCQSCGSTPSCTGSTSSCCGAKTPCYGSTNNCCDQQPYRLSLSTTTQPPTTLSPSPSPPPDTIIKCPAGTILIENKCQLIYCPSGFHMINGRCVVIECPEGTVWMGHRCSVPEPITHNVTFYNTVITQFNHTNPIIINNTNNIVVNASLSLTDNTNDNNDCNNDDCIDTDLTTTTPSQNLNCCIVMTPRMCKNHNDRWRCYSRRSRRCGEFCVAPTIYLKIPRVQVRPHYIIMPPMQYDCQTHGNCGSFRGGYDCSGCAINDMERCSYYCYRYTCPSRRCDFYDQEKYCAHNSGSYGCQEEDGCFDSWCLLTI